MPFRPKSTKILLNGFFVARMERSAIRGGSWPWWSPPGLPSGLQDFFV